MGELTAAMRPFGRPSDEQALTVEATPTAGVVAVGVPVFGHLLLARLTGEERYRAVIVDPDGKTVDRAVTVADDELLVELLPNSNRQDRLVVVVRGLA